jgi:hypothetical protein
MMGWIFGSPYVPPLRTTIFHIDIDSAYQKRHDDDLVLLVFKYNLPVLETLNVKSVSSYKPYPSK